MKVFLNNTTIIMLAVMITQMFKFDLTQSIKICSLVTIFLSYFVVYINMVKNYNYLKSEQRINNMRNHTFSYVGILFFFTLFNQVLGQEPLGFYDYTFGLLPALLISVHYHFSKSQKNEKESFFVKMFSWNSLKNWIKNFQENQKNIKELKEYEKENIYLKIENKLLKEKNEQLLKEINIEKIYSFKDGVN